MNDPCSPGGGDEFGAGTIQAQYSSLRRPVQGGPVSTALPWLSVTPLAQEWSAPLLVQSFPASTYLVRGLPPEM
jgi:hypothetical protein